ncbi:chromate efflux transporter [Frigidibacter oleivorans]|uniref:chromate efflux transporter n=1 Tax=Frigidibacter oleivorans TaxID=2487129 RepID=UPI000F8F3A2D|nr:chromate efflux transporter [Frigidibacter oleivorans]
MTDRTVLGGIARTFLRIGLLSFGGPAAQIALMHRVLVDEERWLTEAEYLRALSLCMLLPGPEAMQLATYAGWRRGGIAGGLIAGGLFVGPGALIILALAAAYVAWGQVPLVAAAFLGIKAAVAAIVIEALIRVARRSLTGPAPRIVAALAFAGLFVLGLPFPAILIAAAIWGALAARGGTATAPEPVQPGAVAQGLRAAGGLTLLWLAPLAVLALAGADFLLALGLFFAKLALLTFGGAYAVLAWMVEEMAAGRGWVTTAGMMDALGLAETTPGPLILVTAFAAFLAGQAQGGAALALAAALLTLWMTFLPSFAFIFAFAPQVGRLVAMPRLAGALKGVTAAVVGVIAHLAAVFVLHLLFGPAGDGPLALPAPDWGALNLGALAIALLAGWLLLLRHWPVLQVLAVAAGAGLAAQGIGAAMAAAL